MIIKYLTFGEEHTIFLKTCQKLIVAATGATKTSNMSSQIVSTIWTIHHLGKGGKEQCEC